MMCFVVDGWGAGFGRGWMGKEEGGERAPDLLLGFGGRGGWMMCRRLDGSRVKPSKPHTALAPTYLQVHQNQAKRSQAKPGQLPSSNPIR